MFSLPIKKKEAIYFLIVSSIYSIKTRRNIVKKREGREHCKYGTLSLKKVQKRSGYGSLQVVDFGIDSVTQQMLYSCTPHPFLIRLSSLFIRRRFE
jgi:hypothetical protein